MLSPKWAPPFIRRFGEGLVADAKKIKAQSECEPVSSLWLAELYDLTGRKFERIGGSGTESERRKALDHIIAGTFLTEY